MAFPPPTETALGKLAGMTIPCLSALRHNAPMAFIRLFFALTLFCQMVLAAEADIIMDTAERHARLQTQGLPGKISIRAEKTDTSRLPPCTSYEAYTPPGVRLMGKSTIGVRCHGPNIWNVLVQVNISVTGSYVTTARALLAGQTIQPGDLHVLTGDISSLPTGIVAEPDSAVGKTLRNSLGAGQLLRRDQLVSPLVIRQGQSVRVISKGDGFSVSSEGKAVNNATEGQLVPIRMSSGQTITGVAKADGTVEITN